MIALALQIIMHQPIRFAAALMGISFAAGLAFIQLGLYMGFKENASIIVDNTDGEIWVCARHQENFDFPKQLEPRTLDLVRSTRGVKSANPLLIVFSKWKLLSGAEKTVEVVGFDASPDHGVGGPWRLLRGFADDLDDPGAMTVDTTAQEKLDDADLGSMTEVGDVEARVVGVTDGIRSFQGNPVLFTDLNNARSFGHLPFDAVHYIVVVLEPGAIRADVLNNLRNIEYTEAYTSEEFSKKAQDYWLNSTGAGPALFMAALMGLIVGVVVVGQVLYTSTLENLKEYGTLKAMGASNFQVIGAIVAQAVAGAVPAHLIAGVLLYIASQTIGGMGIHLSFNLQQYCYAVVFTILVCVAASMMSVKKVLSLEPALVFKG